MPVLQLRCNFSLGTWIAVAVFLLLLGNVRPAQAQPDNRVVIGDSRGKDFWVCFPQNAHNDLGNNLQLKLYITGDKGTKGVVSVPGFGFRKEFALNAGDITSVDLDSNIEVLASEQRLKVGVHIESDNDVAVFGLSTRKASTDTYLALPTNVLGTAYRALCYYPPAIGDNGYASEFAIVATQDHTNVTIDLTANSRGGRKKGETFGIELQQGEVYMVQGSPATPKLNDLSGSLVTSDKPIAFLVGHACAQIPPDVNFCDQLLEEEPPIPSWGRQFYVGKMLSKTEYALRVMASEDSTQVFINNKLVSHLKAGQFYEDNRVKDNVLVTSNKPVLTMQYAQSADADTVRVGDPFMMLITPTEQFLRYYRFATPVQGDWHHYLNLCVPIEGIPSLRVDGRAVPAREFHKIGLSKFAIAQYEVGFKSHTVSCDLPFGLYSYGFGVNSDNYDSYGNPGGQLVETVPLTPDTLRPTLELVSPDGKRSLALIARDDQLFDQGLKSITIIDSQNFRSPVSVPRFDMGTPQVPLLFRIQDTSTCGFMSLRLVDVAGNESYWVICRTLSDSSWIYSLSEGRENICPSCRSWTAQFISTPSSTTSSVSFNRPDYLKGAPAYSDFSTRLSGGFSGLFIYPLNKEISLAGGIGYANITGAAIARNSTFVNDSILWGDTAGARRSKLIEDFTTEASLNYLTINGGFYYYMIPEKLYIYTGLAAGVLLASSYVETSQIVFPATVEYAVGRSGGTRTLTLAQGSLPHATPFHIALELAPGLQFKLSQKISLLAGAYMNFPFFDAVSDLNWHLTSFGMRIGLQYRH